jgi:hypothetical protein
MATQTILVDDIDGSTLDVKTVRLRFDGTDYELELSASNRAELKSALRPYLSAARTKGSSSSSSKRTRSGAKRRRGLAEWASANGYEYRTGRVADELAAAYDAAHEADAA